MQLWTLIFKSQLEFKIMPLDNMSEIVEIISNPLIFGFNFNLNLNFKVKENYLYAFSFHLMWFKIGEHKSLKTDYIAFTLSLTNT